MSNKHSQFDGFTINLEEEDSEWLAHFVELPNVSAYGDTAEDAIHELEIAWELMKESYQERNEQVPIAPSRKHYSGAFNVRLDKRLHRSLATEAARAGVSLNALVAQKLTVSVFNTASDHSRHH